MNIWTALFLGLVGSLHCAGMCGPLVLALPRGTKSFSGFLVGRLAYNAGRVITYCMLGMIFGLVGRTLLMAGVQRWTSIILGLLLLLSLFSSRKLSLLRPVTALIEALKVRMSALLRQRSVSSLALLGLLNGLLPCGLVYVACAGATATGGVLAGILYMAAFGLGTVPMILGIGVSGHLIPLALRIQLRKAIPVSIFLLASLLILRGLSLGIPYVSPDLSAARPSCCQK